MSNKLVLYIGGFQLPEGNAATQRVINNSKILSQLGYKVFLKGVKGIKENTSAAVDIDFEYQTSKYPNSIRNWITHLTSIYSIKQTIKLIGKPSIIIAYNYPSIAMFRLMRFCKKNKIYIVSDCTEWYGFQGKNYLLKFIKWIDSTLTMKVINKKVDGLIVISDFLYNYYSFKKVKILIPPLVDKDDKIWSNVSKILPDDKINIIYFGSMGKHKDSISDFLHAIEFNPKIHFIVIGITKAEYLNFFPKDSNVIKCLQGKIEFLNRLSHSETIEYLKACDYMVFFRDFKKISNCAGFPTKFVEAYSNSVPVITNNNSNLKMYLRSGINGLTIDNKNFAELREACLNLSKKQSALFSKHINDMEFHYANYIENFDVFFSKIEGSR
ncbi:MAG: glycosyltransferase [Acholeplasma sp.]|nr:glycosyltransferase [Acholeplasma sp.]